jgi:hypothetical protein
MDDGGEAMEDSRTEELTESGMMPSLSRQLASRPRVLSLFVLSVVLGLTATWLVWWAAMNVAITSIGELPAIALLLAFCSSLAVALLFTGFRHYAMRNATPANRAPVIWAGMAATAGWLVLSVPAAVLGFIVSMTVLAGHTADPSGPARDFRVGALICALVGLLNSWLCSQAIARRVERTPSWSLTLAFAVACVGLGVGLPLGVPVLRARAEKRQEERRRAEGKAGWDRAVSACEEGSANDCYELAKSLANGRAWQDPSAEELESARHLYERACDLAAGTKNGPAPWACREAAQAYLSEQYAAPDTARAVPLLERGCLLGDAIGCDLAADVFFSGQGAAKDQVKALALRQAACDHGSAKACLTLGDFYDRGELVARDISKSAALYFRGCRAHDDDACRRLEERCHGDYPKTCNYAFAIKLADNDPEAVRLYGLACDAGDGESCVYARREAEARRLGFVNELYVLGCDGKSYVRAPRPPCLAP